MDRMRVGFLIDVKKDSWAYWLIVKVLSPLLIKLGWRYTESIKFDKR